MEVLEEIGGMLEDILIPISICVIMPITMVWLHMRSKKHESDNRTGIVLAALEKNPNIDLEELIQKITPKSATLKEKLLKKLMWGSVISAIGIGFLGYALYMDFVGGMSAEDMERSYFCGGITMLIGLAILLVFFISKRMLAKELEMESEKQHD